MNIKVTFNNEVRRILLKDSDSSMAYAKLEDTCKTLFSTTLTNKPFEIYWKDEDGDVVVISSDMELLAAVHGMSLPQTNLLRFFIREKSAGSDANEEKPAGPSRRNESEEEIVHTGVTCDECGMSPIVGIRYKCAVRENYDLCEHCECAKAQPYPVVKITDPAQAPSALIYVFGDHQPNFPPAATANGSAGDFWQRGARPGYHSFGGPFPGHPRPHHAHPFGHPFGHPNRGPPPHNHYAHPFGSPRGPPPPPAPATTAANSQNPFAQVPPCVNRFTQRCERKAEKLQRKLEKVNDKLSRAVNESSSPFLQAVDSMMTSVFGVPSTAAAAETPSTSTNTGANGTNGNTTANNVRIIPIVTATERPTTSDNTASNTTSATSDEQLEEALIAQAIQESLKLTEEDVTIEITSGYLKETPAATAEEVLSRSTAGVYVNTAAPAVATLPKPALRFVKDITYPNDTVVQPGAHFVKVWRVRNDGAHAWPEGVRLIAAGGDEMSSPDVQVSLPTLHPNQESDVAVELVAPDLLGRYTAYFRAQTKEEQKFGHRLWATVVVADQEADWHVIAQEQQDSVNGLESIGNDIGNGIGFASAGMDDESVSSTPTVPTASASATNASGAAVATVIGNVDISPVEDCKQPAEEAAVVAEEVVMTTSTPTTSTPVPVVTAATAPVVVPGSAAASAVPTTNPAVATMQSRALLWRRELAILEDMGFDDFEIILPLLDEHLKSPVVLQKDVNAAPNVEGMQRVVTALLTSANTRFI